MAKFVIMGQVGNTRKYLRCGLKVEWTDNPSDATWFTNQRKAISQLNHVTNEKEKFIECADHNWGGYYKSPSVMRELAGITEPYNSADIKLSICALSIIPLSTERWHVEDGLGNTKRLS